MPPAVASALERRFAAVDAADPAALWRDLDADLERHRIHHDLEAVNLNPAANLPGPRVSRLLGHTIGSRPSLGHPGAKYETGLEHADRVEATAIGLLRRLTGAEYVEHRVASGALANLYAFLATTGPGDTIMSLGPEAGGHVTHHAAGAAGLLGLEIVPIPYDRSAMTVDLSRLAIEARRHAPVLVVIGGSLVLTPFPVPEIRAIADDVGATLLFDAAHLSGIILGGAHPHPLRQGAHLMTSSTYKSFGGPPGGFVATDDPALAERLDRIAFPGLTANFDLARTAALGAACVDLLIHGPDYAATMTRNAATLAAALEAGGVPVWGPSQGPPTVTHHVAVDATALGGGDAAARLLERAAVLASSIGLPLAHPDPGLRLGTPEVTRRGMVGEDMMELGGIVAAVLTGRRTPEDARPEVEALRRRFGDRLAFCEPV